MKKTNYASGHFAEKIARFLLQLKGYHFVAQNVVTGRGTGAGEIDLIFTKNKTLVFVEVKKRKDLMTAAEAITVKNRTRTIRASEVFIKTHPQYKNYAVRYDAVLFYPKHFPKHIQDAWRL